MSTIFKTEKFSKKPSRTFIEKRHEVAKRIGNGGYYCREFRGGEYIAYFYIEENDPSKTQAIQDKILEAVKDIRNE